jgi:hypothetical protein
VAHLAVRLRDGTGVVGPLVLPGRSACLGCVELHRRSRDPGWPAVAAQLIEREGSADPATAAATAALGVAQVLLVIDGERGGTRSREGDGAGEGDGEDGERGNGEGDGEDEGGEGGDAAPVVAAGAPPVLGATLELDLASGLLLRRPWDAHPDCTCGAPPGETCGVPDERGTIME